MGEPFIDTRLMEFVVAGEATPRGFFAVLHVVVLADGTECVGRHATIRDERGVCVNLVVCRNHGDVVKDELIGRCTEQPEESIRESVVRVVVEGGEVVEQGGGRVGEDATRRGRDGWKNRGGPYGCLIDGRPGEVCGDA